MGIFSAIGSLAGSVLGIGGGGSSVADSSNDVELTVSTNPVVNIDFDGLSEGIVLGLDDFGDDVGGAITSLGKTIGFVGIVAALIIAVGKS